MDEHQKEAMKAYFQYFDISMGEEDSMNYKLSKDEMM